MSSRIDCVTFDARDQRAQATWWAEALGWTAGHADDEAWVDAGGDGAADLLFVPIAEPKTTENRLHLDLRAPDQAAEVARLEQLGATRTDVGQGPDVSWVVLADPEGNELCVLAGPAPQTTVAQVVIHAVDPRLVAEFWAAALGYDVVDEEVDGIGIAPPAGARGLAIDVWRVPEPKTSKNRLHLDLVPDHQDEEVERLEGLGATRVDIGQGDVSWVVLADPEGNELCVLAPRDER